MIQKIVLIFFTLLLTYQLKATEVIYSSNIPHQTTLKAVTAMWGDFDVFEVTDNQRRTHELVCGFNPFYDDKESYLLFKNYYEIKVAKYKIDDLSCLKLFKFLQATFEGVSNETPIIFKLDNQNLVVKSIELPPLNPLQHDPPNKEPSSIKEFANL